MSNNKAVIRFQNHQMLKYIGIGPMLNEMFPEIK